ncbi:MAG: hypothetical protein H6945_07690 [Zoogloeaceae bacterium]|nr:hypothetical protein [Zoogloeaceae bacterium]
MTATTKTRNALRASLKSEDASIEKRLPAADDAAAPSSAAGAGAASEAAAPTGRATKAPASTRSRVARPAAAKTAKATVTRRSAGVAPKRATAKPAAGESRTAAAAATGTPAKAAAGGTATVRTAPATGAGSKPAAASRSAAAKPAAAKKTAAAATKAKAAAAGAAARPKPTAKAAVDVPRPVAAQAVSRAPAAPPAQRPSELFAAGAKAGGKGKKTKAKGKDNKGVKGVEESIAMAGAELVELKALRADLGKKGHKCSKSELMRVGLGLLLAQKPAQIAKRLGALPVLAKAKKK